MTKKLVVLISIFADLLLSIQSSEAGSTKFAFVVTMENTDADEIYGKSKRAPYINEALMPKYARAVNFNDPLPIKIPSEPHYIWMEAGTNVFPDQTFVSDDDPSISNSTSSSDHLVTLMRNSGSVTWMTYQEDINSKTGLCPVASNTNPHIE